MKWFPFFSGYTLVIVGLGLGWMEFLLDNFLLPMHHLYKLVFIKRRSRSCVWPWVYSIHGQFPTFQYHLPLFMCQRAICLEGERTLRFPKYLNPFGFGGQWTPILDSTDFPQPKAYKCKKTNPCEVVCFGNFN